MNHKRASKAIAIHNRMQITEVANLPRSEKTRKWQELPGDIKSRVTQRKPKKRKYPKKFRPHRLLARKR